jgi:hypothetical protein
MFAPGGVMTSLPQSADTRSEATYPYGPAPPVVEDMKWPWSHDWERPTVWLPIPIIAMWLIADFALAPLMDKIGPSPRDPLFVLTVVALGIMGAQWGVLSAWLVWSSGYFYWRLLLYWGAVGVSCWIWIGGLALVARGTDLIDGHCIAALSLPLICVSIQAPLWLVRQAFAWRLACEGTAAATSREVPSTVSNLMLAMSIAAVAAAFARVVPTEVAADELAAMWGFVVGWGAGLSALAVIPIAAWILWQRSWGLGILFAAIYATAGVAALWIIAFLANDRTLTLPNIHDLLHFSVMIYAFAGMLVASALVARANGYRLLIGKRGIASAADHNTA